MESPLGRCWLPQSVGRHLNSNLFAEDRRQERCGKFTPFEAHQFFSKIDFSWRKDRWMKCRQRGKTHSAETHLPERYAPTVPDRSVLVRSSSAFDRHHRLVWLGWFYPNWKRADASSRWKQYRRLLVSNAFADDSTGREVASLLLQEMQTLFHAIESRQEGRSTPMTQRNRQKIINDVPTNSGSSAPIDRNNYQSKREEIRPIILQEKWLATVTNPRLESRWRTALTRVSPFERKE